MKRLFTTFAFLLMLLGVTQMNMDATLSMEHISADMHAMMEMDSGMDRTVDCADPLECEIKCSCQGHLCSAIPSFTALDIAFPSFRKPEYQATLVSLYITYKDRPPQFLVS